MTKKPRTKPILNKPDARSKTSAKIAPETTLKSPEKPQILAPESPAQIILLAVSGMSPAILTETVWALSEENPPVIPDTVRVLTTIKGREDIRRELFTPKPEFGGKTVWNAIREALKKRGLKVDGRLDFADTGDHIRVLTARDADGMSMELSDLRTRAENASAADFVLERVREITERPDTHLIASIAGGRKTMGALLYACMTLLGRETDRLTHVLINEPFEDPRLKPRFFFPAQPASKLTLIDPRQERPTIHSAGDARIELADVPFVAVRNLFNELVGKPGAFSRLVQRCSQRVGDIALRNLKLVVDRARPRVLVNKLELTLSNNEYLLLRYLAEHTHAGKPWKCAKGTSLREAARVEIAQLASTIKSRQLEAGWTFREIRDSDIKDITSADSDWISKKLSDLKKRLNSAGMDGELLSRCLPDRARFSLELSPEQISFLS
jgi:CRISPR-associated protein (TIGR02584 family)